MKNQLIKPIADNIGQFEKEYPQITEERKKILKQLAAFIEQSKKLKPDEAVDFIFICTHNSRRSHIAQIWAQAAAVYYDVKNIRCYSGGTKATAIYPGVVKAMGDLGFYFAVRRRSENPLYKVYISETEPYVIAYSKIYSVKMNPSRGFAAVMVCSQADKDCPVVKGTNTRISLPYNDPKDFDGTPLEEAKYRERALEIGREICYAFSQVN
jgi:arsenate reductase (thioredoxin)